MIIKYLYNVILVIDKVLSWFMVNIMINKIKSKSVLNKHKKRDSWFLEDYTLNPYLGCSFNCVYCYVCTKSDLILRDIDILKKIDKSAKLPQDMDSSLGRGIIITFSFSTMDLELARIFEPSAPSPLKRLEVMNKLKKEGFLVGACLMPLLPFISDTPDQLETMISKVKNNGGDFILTGGMTLFGDKPTDCRVKYYSALEKHFPEVLQKTKLIFDKSDYPPFDYQSKISKLASDICAKYNIRTSII